jgi:putative N6-adenine-specific DNA methylase
MTWQIFASSAPGLEQLLADEIRGLLPVDFHPSHRPSSIEVVPGGVSFGGSTETLGHALVGLGLAARVLVRVAEFPVRHLNELEKLVARLPWADWLRPTEPVEIRATAKKSKLFHTGAIQERVARGIQQAGGPASATAEAVVGGQAKSNAGHAKEHPPGRETVRADETRQGVLTGVAEGEHRVHPGVLVRIERDLCRLSLDVSGQPLHRRGYRVNPYQAPLREDLARALVMVSGWDRLQPLVDPCCGSGTVLIEAALWANRIPPGLGRDFALEATALSDPAAIRLIKRQRLAWAEATVGDGRLAGFDRDPGAIAAAQLNWQQWHAQLTRARVLDAGTGASGGQLPTIQWEAQDMMRLAILEAPVTWVTNPPWGDRIQPSGKLVFLYQRLGELRRQSGPASRLALITLHRELAYKTGVPLASAFLTDAGGLKVNAFVEPGLPSAAPGQDIATAPTAGDSGLSGSQ